MNATSEKLIREMGMDNGCTFVPCRNHESELDSLVERCRLEGLRFTSNQVELITAGEQTEMEKLLSRFPSGAALNKCLGQIFDGCKACTIKK